jgi:hypothetical protein
MQEKLGLNVVNLSLHAGLGGSFMLREAGSVVKSGDTVVVCLEYILYESGHEDVDLIEHTQFIYPEATAYYRFGLIESSLESYAHFKKVVDYCRYNPFRKNENGGGFGPVYNRQNFNRYGDIVARIGENDTPRNLKGGTKLGSIVLDASMVQAFHDIASRCKAVGARLYLTYPPYPKSWYLLNKSVIGGLESQIRKKLDFIPTISDPIAFVMDESCFYDTVNHLTTIGSDQRTAILIAELKTALPDRVASGNVTPSNTAALSSY